VLIRTVLSKKLSGIRYPAITVQHFELRNLAQFIRPGDLAAGWAALGFDPINPRWGQNKITNQEGEKALGAASPPAIQKQSVFGFL